MALVATAFTGIEIGAGVRAQSGSSETPVPELTLTVVLLAATEATWPGGHRNRVAAVERGITPAFGYGAPYPGASGTSTQLIWALPSRRYGPGPTPRPLACSAYGSRLPEPARTEIRARMRSPRFRTIDVSTGMGSPTARGPTHTCLSLFVWDDIAFFSPERDRHLGKASFAAQYPAHGLPRERFTSALANCRADSGPERFSRPYSVADFSLLILCQLILALLRFVLRSARQRLRSLGERWSK